MPTDKKRLYLIDGSAIAYRAYFAFIRNPLINSKGENTSAVFGFVNSVYKIIKDEKPDYLAIIFDTKAPTFRHKMYDDYKSTRAKMPDDMVLQLPRIHEAIKALNIFEYEQEGFEADDILVTLADQAVAEGLEVRIVTGDKDLFQAVNDHIKILAPQRGSEPPLLMDKEAVKNKIGVYPERVIDFLSLTGDSSDNIPGIPGVGPKTALNLLGQFGDLDTILEKADEIKAKGIRQKVLDNKEGALLSRTLVTIDRNVPLDFKNDDMAVREPDFKKCYDLFTDLEFFNLLKDIMGEAHEPIGPKSQIKSNYKRIKSTGDLKRLVNKLSQVKELAIDTETDSLISLRANLVGISLCAKAGEAFYIPVGHTEGAEKNLPANDVRKILQPLLKSPKVQKTGQNIKYDLQVLGRAGYEINPVSFDTMLASYVINPSARGHDLSTLALDNFNHTMIPITDLIGSGKNQKSFATVEPDKATEYAAEDADFTYRLRGVFASKIEELKLAGLYYDIEIPLISVLSRIEEAGVRIDLDYLESLSHKMEGDIKSIVAGIYEMAGYEFNINSTQQMSKLLFEEKGLPKGRKTSKKTGYSTDQRVLEDLAEIDPLPRAVLEYRQLSKLKSTYVDALPRLINPETGRLHTSFNQSVAATGRLSSSDPNLQNIPVRTETGREIRKAFIPRDENYSLLVADYSQIELRILAHISEDKGLISAFKKGEDIHSRTAAEVYGVAIKNVTGEQRRAAKTANFAVIYGVSAYGLSQQTELNLGESKQFIDTYFERYPGIRKYMDEMIQTAREKGFVTTLSGRRRYLPEINSRNFQRRQFAERIAINSPIQGTAADMIKIAMIRIDSDIAKMKSKMILQVHDELVFDAYNDELEELQKIVQTRMSKAIRMKVPLIVDMGVGPNWLEAK